MITSIKITSGYAANSKLCGKRTYRFKPGINLVMGQNGTGKSSLLKILAAFTGCGQSGWSSFVVNSPLSFTFKEKSIRYPIAFKNNSPGGCGATVKWSGYPVYFYDPAHSDHVGLAGFGDFDHNLLDTGQSISQMMGKPSPGQVRLDRLQKIFQGALCSVPDLMEVPEKYMHPITGAKQTLRKGDPKRKAALTFVEYIKSLRKAFDKVKGSRCCTVLFDEPDAGLSVVNEITLWKNYLIPMSEQRYQVIMATNSVLALIMGKQLGANFVDLDRGWTKESWNALKPEIEGIT